MKVPECSFIFETKNKKGTYNCMDNSVKILGVIALLFEIIVLVSIYYLCNAVHYEIDIFGNIPLYVWALLGLSIIISCNILKYNLENDYNKFNFFIYYYLVTFLNIVFISLPIIKGYAFYDNADPFTHIGLANTIIKFGNTPSTNFYPILHILIAITHIVVNIDVLNLYRFISIIVSIGFFIFFYLWIKTVYSDKNFILISTSLSLILFLKNGFYTNIVPNGFSLMLMPLIMFILSKKSPEYKILLVIFLFLIPFSHPLTTIMLGVILICTEISTFAYNKYISKISSDLKFNSFLILVTSFISWISSFYIINKTIMNLISFIKMELISPITEIGSGFDKLSMSTNDRVIYSLKVYFPQIIIVLLAFVSIFYIGKLLKSSAIEKPFSLSSFLVSISISFISIGIMLLIALLVGDPGIMPIRSANFVFILSIPLTGYLLSQLYSQINVKSYIIFLVIILLIAFPYFSALITLYDSPYIKQPGRHVTYAQFDGMEWFFSSKNESVKSTQLSAAAPWRFSDVLYDASFKDTKRNDLSRYNDGWIVVPDHFNNLVENVPNRYLIISEFDYECYIKLWSEFDRYNLHDYRILENNNDVITIYSNGDIIVRYIGSDTHSQKS